MARDTFFLFELGDITIFFILLSDFHLLNRSLDSVCDACKLNYRHNCLCIIELHQMTIVLTVRRALPWQSNKLFFYKFSSQSRGYANLINGHASAQSPTGK